MFVRGLAPFSRICVLYVRDRESFCFLFKRTNLEPKGRGKRGTLGRVLLAGARLAATHAAPRESTMLSSPASDGQVTLEAHHASARKILLAVQQQLDLLETGRDTSIEIQSEISQRLNTLSREVQTIEELLPYAASDKRKVWGRRVQQLKADQRAQSALARSSARRPHRHAQGYSLSPRGEASQLGWRREAAAALYCLPKVASSAAFGHPG